MAAAGMDNDQPAAKAGDLLEGRYRILDTIGAGGMGSVFLAEHQLIKRRVAIKILHRELATDANVVERFMNEARAAGTLGHPNIVESTDMGFTPEHVPYIVFEHLEGTGLTDEIYRVGGFSLRRALWVAMQITSALHAAHEAGVIHRDLKSDNVFLTDRAEMLDHVKVLDFGISRFTQVAMSASDSKMIMGTPEYLAPEAITNPGSIDRRADIYALGVILYEMLTGRLPFRAEHGDNQALLERIVRDAPPPLGAPEVPPELDEIIARKLLAKDPDDRYGSMLEVETALEKFVKEKPTPMRRGRTQATRDPMTAGTPAGLRTPPPGSLPAVAEAPAKPRFPRAPQTRATWPIVVGIVGVVIGLAGVVVALTKDPVIERIPCDCSKP